MDREKRMDGMRQQLLGGLPNRLSNRFAPEARAYNETMGAFRAIASILFVTMEYTMRL
jgi:hypothetical protein